MKILYLTFDDLTVPFAWSVHVRSIVNGLVARGHTVRLICPAGKAPGVQADLDVLPKGKFHHWAGSLATFVNCGRAFGPDAIYVRGIHGTITPALAAGRLSRPLVVEVNGLLEHEVKGVRRAIARNSHRFTLARTARVVTVSPLLKEALASRYGFPADHIDVVPNGVDTDLFKPADRDEARQRLRMPLDRKIVVCVAGFFSHHALDLLIAAASRTEAQLILVGKEGPSGGDIVHAGRVPHSEVPHYLAAADVCAYVLRSPHAQFGFSPIKVYEYMAAGRPVVAATNLPEIRSFINNEGIGVATDLGVDEFAVEIARVLDDPEKARNMGRKGRELAEAQFGWNRAVVQVEESLRRALQA